MQPDDPRHGTNAGYIAGCRQDCCRAANLRYSKRLKVEHSRGQRRTTETWRAVRRLDALACLGWSRGVIADEIGIKHKCQLYAIGDHPRISLALFNKIDAAYNRLSMKLAPTETGPQKVAATKARKNARLRGGAPPLAWNDIDDPDETPGTVDVQHDLEPEQRVDFAVVERLINDRTRLRRLTNAEATEAVRRLLAAGASTTEIEKTWGLKPDRYFHINDTTRGAA